MKSKYNWIYLLYFICLGRGIQLLSNGYSNKLTGFWLLLNMIVCLILSYKIIIKRKIYNKYLISFIMGFSLLLVNYSGYRDLNKRVNKVIIIIFILSIIIQCIFMLFNDIKLKKYKNIFFLTLSFIGGFIFTRDIYEFYNEPQRVVYSTNISKIKDKKEMIKIISNMPLVDNVGMYTAEIVKGEPYYVYNFNETENRSDELIEIYLTSNIDNESMDQLATRINWYLKLINKEKKLIRLYMLDKDYNENAIKIYDLQNGNMTVRYKRTIIQDKGLLSSTLHLIIVKFIKGVDINLN